MLHSFIRSLEQMAPTDAIRAMRESSEYEAFERKWQLPVYFQLRWKEIKPIQRGRPSRLAGTQMYFYQN
jgi:hypothetical protein